MKVDSRSFSALASATVGAALLAAQRTLLVMAARLESPVDLMFDPHRPVTANVVRHLPYHVVDQVFGPPVWIHVALVLIGVLETVVLYAMYRALRVRYVGQIERFALCIVAALMVAIALDVPVVNGFDAYADAGYAKLGLAHAYAPPAKPFGGDFAIVNAVWGTPMRPDTAGPGWVALTSAVTGRIATLGGAVFSLRCIEVVALLGLIGLVARRGANTGVLALVALNPAIYFAFIVNAHSDLFGATLLVGALVAVAAVPLGAAALIACAGLVKLPFLLLAPAVFADRGSVAARIGWVVFAAALACGISFLLGGRPYFVLLEREVHGIFAPGDRASQIALVLRCALLAVAAFALVSAFVRGIVWRGSTWSFVAIVPMLNPAALGWPLLYAALARPVLAEFLMLLPLAAALLDASFPRAGLGALAVVAAIVYAIADIIRRRPTAMSC